MKLGKRAAALARLLGITLAVRTVPTGKFTGVEAVTLMNSVVPEKPIKVKVPITGLPGAGIADATTGIGPLGKNTEAFVTCIEAEGGV
jgi:hypothetical protein